ncbi:hypothetical protein PQO03_01750 [Lentisphaera profundi]|uniref:Lipoprotein n=1 Tax=Lentisphaera profundi TaxID=1658616 RepID=A0ABY7VTQ2_9BACT|nr:hypothetical protein [Lentisphaera profundi]WDE96689.1 hypothetical protein PQO03_01750 [Lentisphaera profundi]
MKYFVLIICVFIFTSCKDEKANTTSTDDVTVETVVMKGGSENLEAAADCATGCPSCGVKESFELKAPHGGALMKFGGDAAVLELVIDHKSGEMSVYFYDGLAKEQLKLEQTALNLKINTLNITLKADEKGVFRLKSEIIKGLKKFQGTVGKLEVDGLPFDGVPIYYPEGN